MSIGDERKSSKDGIELTLATNVIGPLYLNSLLLDVLKAAKPSRVIYVSSALYKYAETRWDDLEHQKLEPFKGQTAYKNSKLVGNMVFMHLNKLIEKEGIKVVLLHPGVIRTDLARNYFTTVGRKVAVVLLYPLIYFVTKNVTQGS